MVPDFVLARAAARGRPELRVFVEVIGFWTPAYRERKRDKLRQLGANVPLVLVVQETLATHFEGLPFPLLTYRSRVSAADLVRLLNRTYARPEEAAPAVREDLVALLEVLDPALGFVGAEEVRRALELPSGGALADALAAAPLTVAGWRWLPGAGVAHERWLEGLGALCAAALAAGGGAGEDGEDGESGKDGEAPLETVREAISGADLPSAARAAEQLEALLGPLGYEVAWQSLFEATVRRAAPAAPSG
jgi:hypothetical protein